MNASTAQLFVDTFLQPDCDIPEMVKSRTKMYLSMLLYSRQSWEIISGWRYWGHIEVFNNVTTGLDALGVRYKTEKKFGCWHIYVYSKQSKEVNQMALKAVDDWCNKDPRREAYRVQLTAYVK